MFIHTDRDMKQVERERARERERMENKRGRRTSIFFA